MGKYGQAWSELVWNPKCQWSGELGAEEEPTTWSWACERLTSISSLFIQFRLDHSRAWRVPHNIITALRCWVVSSFPVIVDNFTRVRLPYCWGWQYTADDVCISPGSLEWMKGPARHTRTSHFLYFPCASFWLECRCFTQSTRASLYWDGLRENAHCVTSYSSLWASRLVEPRGDAWDQELEALRKKHLEAADC